MRAILSFIVLMGLKLTSHLFYKMKVKWISPIKNDWSKIRLVIFLHHTSLYEPIFMGAAPTGFIWRLARKMVAPAADKTLNRPIVGLCWKLMAPGLISITRKRDKSWFKFLELIKQRSVIVIAPEGRMKRSTGLDSTGKPMTVRSGVAEIINELDEGRIMIAYSGGLHHVQHPGEKFPRVFKNINLNLEVLDVHEYKGQFNSDGIQFRKDIVADLENRLKENCPPQS